MSSSAESGSEAGRPALTRKSSVWPGVKRKVDKELETGVLLKLASTALIILILVIL